MLLRAARAPCWRTAHAFAYHPSFAGQLRSTRLSGTHLRVFTSDQGPLQNKSIDEKSPASATAGPASTPTPPQLENANIVQKSKESGDAKTPPKKDLLSEPLAANKEQRKADWAIMKEMAKYLWPKVIPERQWYRICGY
jgi:ATP-binding cassette subfamily B (MDR/TAP) protein 7